MRFAPLPESKLTRRQWIATAAATCAAGAAGYGRFVEPNFFSTTHHTFGADQAAPPLRLVQVSDLHLRHLGHVEHRVAQRLRESAPGIVVLTGDVIDSARALPLLASFLELLDPAVPKVAILGNWEHWSGVSLSGLRALYEQHGIAFLVNEAMTFTHAGRRLVIAGLDDFIGGAPDIAGAIRGSEPATNFLLLQHCPAYRDVLTSAGGDHGWSSGARSSLMLSGHTHGGQVAVPGWAPFRPPGSGRYIKGWYGSDNPGTPPMYVSRGLGTSVARIRIGVPPELAVFDWHLS